MLAQVAVASYVPDGKLQYLVILVKEMKSPLGLMDKVRTSNPKVAGSSPAGGAVASVPCGCAWQRSLAHVPGG